MSNTGIKIKNIDIIKYFEPYTTGQTQNIGMFTNGNVDIGQIFQPYSSGPLHLVGIYINNVDIGTFFQAAYLSGLTVNIYSGYFGDSTVNGGVNSEVVTYDNGKTPTYSGTGITNFTSIYTATNGQKTINGSDNYTVVWNGFFLPDFTGNWTFGITSDDASFMWIGPTASSGYTTANATLNNLGLHAMTLKTKTIALTSGQYYPIRIIFGEFTGGENCTFYYSRNASANSYDFSGKFFYI
jgi:hypothetical protein